MRRLGGKSVGMTVCLDRDVCYGVGVKEVSRVLEAGWWWYCYGETVWNDEGFFFSTNIRPRWWTFLLAMEMQILLQETNIGCRVSVRTTSQRYMLADIFDFYRRFIEDFLARLSTELER